MPKALFLCKMHSTIIWVDGTIESSKRCEQQTQLRRTKSIEEECKIKYRLGYNSDDTYDYGSLRIRSI